MTSYDKHYYDGAWQASTGSETIAVISSATEAEIARVPRGTAVDVDNAVTAARRGFESWSRLSVEERAQWLEKLAAAMKTRAPQIAEAISHEVGTALGYATTVQVEFPIMMIGMNAKFIREAKLQEELGNSLIIKEPVGVVGCITPWNYPLHQIVCKIAPAFAAGCTVVLKPAEMAPLSAFFLAEAAHEIGLPKGVFNVVSGSGRVVGEAIVAHPDVDMVSFTGSLQAGRRIASVAGDGIKKVCLELGGKSAFVVLDDAPFDKAVPAGVNNCMQNSGQTCSAWTRMIVPRRRHDEAVEMAKAQLARLTLGDPFDKNTRLGPLASATQRDTVLDYIETGKKEGAKVLIGGDRASLAGDLAGGYYVNPTILAGHNKMRVFQEEIFGPVVATTSFKSFDEAIAMANDTLYGLGAGVWSRDGNTAYRAGRAIKAGRVWTNCYHHYPAHAAFGGYKQSGIGRENHKMMLDHYQQTKNLLVSYDPKPMGFF